MVTLESLCNEQGLVARTNCSASWQTNRRLILAFGSGSLVSALFFCAIGLWPIAPFLGVEVLAMAGGLYATRWKLEQEHVLRFQPDRLVVEKGTHGPHCRCQLMRAATFVSIEIQPHPWDPLKIFVCDQREHIPIGNFLNRDESRALLQQLRGQGLPIRNFSEQTRQTL
jgi:uncharacterized membrane protein